MSRNGYEAPNGSFMSRKDIEAGPGKRIKADYIRRMLTKGYSPESAVYKITYALSDDEIINGYVEHEKDKRDHEELMKMLRLKIADAESRKKPCPIRATMAAALAEVKNN